MHKRNLHIPIIILFSAFTIAALFIHTTISKSDVNIDDSFFESQGENSISVPLPRKIDFAGESVPLNLFYVREALDRELTINTYWQSQSILLFKRAHRYFSMIEPILKKNGIPDDFKYIVLVESGFLHQVSPAGAAGYWQFLKETAKEYQLEVSEQIDERYDPEKSTQAASKYFKKAYMRYNSWTLTAASFNGGTTRMDRIVKSQKTDNYYEMFMNAETSRYLFRILAMKIVFENPEKYGYKIRKDQMYPVIKTKNIDFAGGSLVTLSQKHGISYRLLREVNPWISDTILSTGRIYTLKIPTGNFSDYDAIIRESVNGNTTP
ncbi:MAG: lytic transglycosylase domain-containing protein [Bacteroidales bacterium]|jgi:hypothetical protein|nr:lytic transglycosylase domain-containing protein [Bacteroidales bacterium]